VDDVSAILALTPIGLHVRDNRDLATVEISITAGDGSLTIVLGTEAALDLALRLITATGRITKARLVPSRTTMRTEKPMKSAVLAAAAVILMSTPAAAEPWTFSTGNDMLAACESPHLAEEMFCLGYIAGITQANDSICPPAGVTFGQQQNIVVKQLRAWPELRHGPAALLAWRALWLTYPCPAASAQGDVFDQFDEPAAE
jgi:Rap1a immunity proteins